MIFEHDKLLAHIRHVNPRTERHGEEEILACDVSTRLMKAENEGAWPLVVRQLCLDQDGALERIDAVADWVVALPFKAAFKDHKVNFWTGNRKPAGLVLAKINKARWSSEDGAQFIDLRIQAQADGETIGAIAELIDHKVRLEVVHQQGELDLGEDPDAED